MNIIIIVASKQIQYLVLFVVVDVDEIDEIYERVFDALHLALRI